MSAMTEAAPVEAPIETQLSADGGWWWNGAEWVPAVSADGLWRWTGTAWEPSVAIDRENPAAVVEAVDRLVDDRFALGGHLLALRAHEWRPRTDEVADLVAQAAPLAARLSAVDGQLAAAEEHSGRVSLRGLLGVGDRTQLESEAHRIDHELRPLVTLIGRTAPQPSLKDADEILVPARRLHERLVELQTALSELRRLRAEHDDRVAAARAELDQATAERDAALAGHSQRVREREDEHRRAVAQLSDGLRALRMPDPGQPRARFRDILLYDHRVETPDGRGPTDGARAVIGTAAELVSAERDFVEELWLLGTEGAVDLHEAVSSGSQQRFLLVVTQRVASAVGVPEGAEGDAEAFAAALTEAETAGRKSRRRWTEQVRAAEAALEAALADTSAVDEARAELERASEDSQLAAPVKAAQKRVRDAERPTPSLTAAEERVRGLVDSILEPPEELRPAAAG